MLFIIYKSLDDKFLKVNKALVDFLGIPKEKIIGQTTFDLILDKAYPNALAILLHHQLKKFEQVSKLRASICDIYSKNFKNQSLKIKGVSLIRYPVIVDQPQKIFDKASEQNIFLGKWYDQVVAPKSVSLDSVRYKPGSCPVAENLCNHIINLPTTISIKDAYKIIKIVNQRKWRLAWFSEFQMP